MPLCKNWVIWCLPSELISFFRVCIKLVLFVLRPIYRVQQEESEKKQRKMLLAKLKFPLLDEIALVRSRSFSKPTGLLASSFTFIHLFICDVIIGCGTQFWIHISRWSSQCRFITGTRNVLLMALIYPIVKIIHEFGRTYL